MMKKILFFLIFTCISSQSFSAVGDLYYCEMTQAIELKEDNLFNIFLKNLNLQFWKII